MICAIQVNISGGKGKPDVVIDKDEGLEKVWGNLASSNSHPYIHSLAYFVPI